MSNTRLATRSICRPLLICAAIVLISLLSPYASAGDEAAKSDIAHYEFKPAGEADERLIFTPPGFDKVGFPAVASENNSGRVKIRVIDQANGQPTFCRINVVGSDGNYYEPARNYLTKYSFTGVWPNWPKAWGNRQGKAPVRYLGRFFYSYGQAEVAVPPGKTRIEVWKGFEYQPVTLTTQVKKGETVKANLTLQHALPMPGRGYYSGDPHIHIPREEAADTASILDLMQAEDIHYGSILAYNEPAGPYSGFLKKMDSPQLQGIGNDSIHTRDGYSILSGQEYRSATYGHLNLFLNGDIVLKGEDLNANNWPLYGAIGRRTQQNGGYAFYAHGGYAKAIYADLVQGDVNGVELLQFGVYRGIGLDDWYHILNCGFRFPITGASDYPACRKLGDCKTYVHAPNQRPSFRQWLQGTAEGRSFVTTGPMLLLKVDGHHPGEIIRVDQPTKKVAIRLQMQSVVAPVSHIQLIVNGRIVAHKELPDGQRESGGWIALDADVELTKSSWVAARAFSLSKHGTPDAESHTNPVYVYFNQRAPYEQRSLDAILEKLDGQMDIHRKRDFKEKSRVLDYFQKSRDLLLAIRADRGMDANARPPLGARNDIDASDSEITAQSLKDLLKPLPPKEPQQALKTFESARGFTMQLVAAEPLVHDPIAAAFDEQGNLYVTEMLDYPYHPREGERPIGRVRYLRDTDGDGDFDESHIFAEELLWAGGVSPWDGGVYVAAPPSIWYLKDTDGDFKADIRREVFSGFGDANQQAMVNNLKFGLDHKIYGATAGNGGEIVTVAKPDDEPILLNGRDFCFDPRTEQFETVTGTVQFGNTFDDWGNRFMCSQGIPARHEVLPQRYLERNPALAVSKTLEVVAPAGIAIHRISPIEAWRRIRVARRRAKNPSAAATTGSTHHVIDASAGTTVYRGDAYPAEYCGDLFIGCGQNNLVHRRKLIPHGVTFQSRRTEQRHEFIRSSDIWFRPVNFVNAPDGTLYCLDMAREFLESIHIPLDVVEHLDLTSGRDRGRIYRMAPPNFKRLQTPRLGQADNAALLTALTSKNGWKRDTAHRLIYQRQDRSMIPALRKIASTHEFPQARLHALWSLQGLGALDEKMLRRAINDSHPRVREHAVRLAEPMLQTNEAILKRVIELSGDNDDRVRFQTAFSLGETDSPGAVEALAALARRDSGNDYLRTAVLSSASSSAHQLFALLWNDVPFCESKTGQKTLSQLMQVVGSRAEADQVRQVLSRLAAAHRQQQRAKIAVALFEQLSRALIASGVRATEFSDLPAETKLFLKRLVDSAAVEALNEKLKPEVRRQALGRLTAASFEETSATWSELMRRPLPATLKVAVVRTLGEFSDQRVSELLLTHWRTYSPEIRKTALDVLLARETGTLAFLRAAEREEISVTAIDETRRTLLIKHRNPEIAQAADKLIGRLKNSPRTQVVEQYRQAFKLKGNPDHGREVFNKTCSTCHKVAGLGTEIGPDLMGTLSQDTSRLVEHVFDPNRYVAPEFVQYLVEDLNGRSYSGMIGEQNATSVTLRREKNESVTILRRNIDRILSTGKSLMPEGLEKTLTPQGFADLIAFLQREKRTLDRQAQQAEKRRARDFGTIPGFVDPGKR